MKFLPLISLLLSTSAFAGAANIELDCVSDSGRTKVVGNVPGDMAEHEITFTIDGQSVHYVDTAETTPNSTIEVKGDARKQSFAFVISAVDAQPVFSFREIPGSGKIQRTPNGEKGSLRAIVQGVDPRDGSASKEIEVRCTYRYEI
jgi:hypothetical protein